ncbi:MAG TPA: hypothetical protein VJI13_00745 [Candidatus Norongarragalinales archaeon]|nr:hypothetical protein [Candidatus Norongarragalinales archaeon]
MDAHAEIMEALALTFLERGYALIGILAAAAMACLYVFLPITLVPGNSLGFFLEITPWWGLLTIFMLAGLMGILIAMQAYVIRNTKSKDAKEIGSGIGAFVSSIISGLFATASCAACVSVLFSFMGTAGIFFLLEHRIEITLFGFAMVTISIYLTARRINNHCEECKITKRATD